MLIQAVPFWLDLIGERIAGVRPRLKARPVRTTPGAINNAAARVRVQGWFHAFPNELS